MCTSIDYWGLFEEYLYIFTTNFLWNGVKSFVFFIFWKYNCAHSQFRWPETPHPLVDRKM
jgi:hypothetical protein